MKNNYLIIVTGQVATGKTRFARLLSEKLNIPLVSKDNIKEMLFDELGYSDREWSKKLGIACYKIMYQIIEQFISKSNIILESNFNSEISGNDLRVLKKKHKFKIIQAFLYADAKILYDRFKKRNLSRERHPGHIDHKMQAEFEARSLTNGADPIKIDSEIIKINTDNFSKLNYNTIINMIKRLLK